MGLIDRKQAHADACQPRCDISKIEALRRKIEKSYLASGSARETIRHLRRSQRAVDERRGKIACFERIHLVLHQRDQWRNNDCQSGKDECGYLVAHRFSSARGKHDQCITPGEHRLDCHLLAGPELIVTERCAQRGARIIECRSSRSLKGFRHFYGYNLHHHFMASHSGSGGHRGISARSARRLGER